MRSKFQRRHYNAVADILRDAAPIAAYDSANARWSVIVEAFIMLFKADNPHFQPQRFRDACDPPRWEATAAGKEELLKKRRAS